MALGYRRPVEQLAEYIVLQRLSGNAAVLKAIYMYFVLGASPSVIAGALGMTKNAVRGYIARVYEKAYPVPRPSIGQIVGKLVRRAARIPVAVRDGVCAVCGERVEGYAVHHVMRRHPDLVMRYALELIPT